MTPPALPAHPHQVGSLTHELLGRLFPDGGHRQHPAHCVLLWQRWALLPQLLEQEGVVKGRLAWGGGVSSAFYVWELEELIKPQEGLPS